MSKDSQKTNPQSAPQSPPHRPEREGILEHGYVPPTSITPPVPTPKKSDD